MDDFPQVSIIIVVRNGINYIDQAIKSVQNQTYPRDKIELIIVDGMSSDGSLEFSHEKAEELCNLGTYTRVFENPKKSLASGWNIAINASNADYICRIDVHSELASNYIHSGILSLLNEAEHNSKIVAVGGWLQNVSGDGFSERAIVSLLRSPFGVGNSPVRRPEVRLRVTDTVAYGIYNKNAVIHAGLYDEKMLRNQDIDLNYRLNKLGFIFLTHPDMRAIYNVRNSIYKLLIKSYSDGAWVLKTPGKKVRHVIPFAFFIYVILLIPFYVIYGVSFPVVYFPLILYLVFCLWFGFQNINRFSALLTLLFPLLHLSYGLGTFVSLFSILK